MFSREPISSPVRQERKSEYADNQNAVFEFGHLDNPFASLTNLRSSQRLRHGKRGFRC